MSYAIIRNAKYKMSNLSSVARHNERQNKKYGNTDIDPNKAHLNYHLVKPIEKSYTKEFERLKETNDLKGNLRLTGAKQSNIACEFLITSDKAFFEKMGDDGTRKFFESAFEFAKDKVGEKNIISAVVHMDESTPHMHLTYIPVVEGVKKGVTVNKVNCSEFWKGFNSYGILQDDFHAFITDKGYELDRGEKVEDPREHIPIAQFKKETLETEITTLQTDLNALRDVFDKLQDFQVKLESFDYLNAKTGSLLNKGKVLIPEEEFLELLGGAKKSLAQAINIKDLTVKMEKQKDLVDEYREFADRLEVKLKGKEKDLKGLKDKLSKQEYKIEIVKEFLETKNLTEEMNEYGLKQMKAQKELKANKPVVKALEIE